jgi:hypothetical protein
VVIAIRLPVAITLLSTGLACDREERAVDGAAGDERAPHEAMLFAEVTAALGLPPKTAAWPDGTFATPEITPGGVALFDYDNDGRLDIYQVCHGRPGRFDEPAPNRLFRQEPDGSFREVPGAGGLNDAGYGHGVAVGDYDNDGYPDVYVTNFGRDALYRNNGDGSFTNVTTALGMEGASAGPVWGSSATFVDYDRDGHLDLVACRFATFEPSRVCPSEDGKPDYCGPAQFRGLGITLYRNNGDGTFADVTKRAGVDYPGRGWGVTCADLTGDGWVDIYVANDEERQNLWVNQRDGTFRDEAMERGVAYSGAGRPEAGMGVALGDIANDGRLSLFITHIRNEKNTLYSPATNGTYLDRSAAARMAAVDLPYTGWGCGFVDYDNDGNLDVALVNGDVSRGPVHPKAVLGPFWNPYGQPNLLFRGDGAGRFTDASASAGDFADRVESTRGLAFGDIDNDGRVDLASNTTDNTLRVYRNVTPTAGAHWLRVRAMVDKRDALGARVEITGGGRRWTRLAQAGYSYCSSNDPRCHFGLGAVDRIEAIDVTWPDGRRERFAAPGVDRDQTVRQGEGQPPPG